MPAAPPHLSYSQISSMLKCGHAYELERLWGAPQVPSWWLVGGKAVHHATEIVDEHLHVGDILSLEAVGAITSAALDVEIAVELKTEPDKFRWQAGNRGTEHEEWWRVHATEMVWRWQEFRISSSLDVLELDGAPAVELEMTMTSYGFPFKLFIDRVMIDRNTSVLAILDIKTGKNEPKSPYQLAFYRDAVRENLGLDVTWGFYWMARKGAIGVPHDLSKVTPAMTSTLAAGVRQMIDQGLFLPNVGPLCGSCGVRAYCSSVGGDASLLSERRVDCAAS